MERITSQYIINRNKFMCLFFNSIITIKRNKADSLYYSNEIDDGHIPSVISTERLNIELEKYLPEYKEALKRFKRLLMLV